jgi:hypothetical protein
MVEITLLNEEKTIRNFLDEDTLLTESRLAFSKELTQSECGKIPRRMATGDSSTLYRNLLLISEQGLCHAKAQMMMRWRLHRTPEFFCNEDPITNTRNDSAGNRSEKIRFI